jgi:hypothetical protein
MSTSRVTLYTRPDPVVEKDSRSVFLARRDQITRCGLGSRHSEAIFSVGARWDLAKVICRCCERTFKHNALRRRPIGGQ